MVNGLHQVFVRVFGRSRAYGNAGEIKEPGHFFSHTGLRVTTKGVSSPLGAESSSPGWWRESTRPLQESLISVWGPLGPRFVLHFQTPLKRVDSVFV